MILVTGGTGLLGLHLLIELLKKNTDCIIAIYRSEEKLSATKNTFLRISTHTNPEDKWNQIKWIKADITDIPSLEKAFIECTEVYHCAALVSFQNKDFLKLKKINIEGTANMINLSIQNKIQKFCYVSSIATLNLNPGESIYTEDSQWNNEAENSGYAISKHGGEMEVWRGIQEGLNAVIVNPGVILGAGFYHGGSSKIFNTVNKGLSFYTEGSTGFIGVKDCVKSIIQLMYKEKFNERFILIAENKNYKSVIDIISLHLKVKSPRKVISKKLLFLLSKIENVFCLAFKQNAKIPLDMVNSLTHYTEYSNQKITTALNFNFENIDMVIEKITKDFNLLEH